MSVSTTTNSSPPSRATTSASLTLLRRRSATLRSSWSPAWWPSESFTVLKWSRFMNSTAIIGRGACGPATAPATAVHQEVPVGQLREAVVRRAMKARALGLFAGGDVAHHHDAVVRVVQRHGLAHHLDRKWRGHACAEWRYFKWVFPASLRVVEGHGMPPGLMKLKMDRPRLLQA